MCISIFQAFAQTLSLETFWGEQALVVFEHPRCRLVFGHWVFCWGLSKTHNLCLNNPYFAGIYLQQILSFYEYICFLLYIYKLET